MSEQQISFDNMIDDPFHPVTCIVCGTVEPRWVDIYICDHCHTSGRAAVEYHTLKEFNDQMKKDLAAYRREERAVADELE